MAPRRIRPNFSCDTNLLSYEWDSLSHKTFRWAAAAAAAWKPRIVDWCELRPAPQLSVPWQLIGHWSGTFAIRNFRGELRAKSYWQPTDVGSGSGAVNDYDISFAA